ncbi:hypothetical protein BpOF4_21129 (plasmid) [Alkalihalophilus pseudofirmus OF4]|uniref:ABC transporter permease n=1 Tax=Alkalihalophilus pseudofirmus (strain ATCC BAA-2126 / JCM 17055 / OF4) TaxID=398511 RepID=D3G1J5_ALKPO|nr:hypothetical protein [Alkalihalophilus pseudofirmus]ADC52221.1 hypothetical protein BpOF4_21129 [Alkalihalophilus pseudofirmus OF4]
MDSVTKAIIFGASLLMAIAFITIGVQLFGTSTEASKAATNDYSSIQTELSEQKYLAFEGTTVSGSQVGNAIRRFQNEDNFGIQVITGKNSTGTWYHHDASNSDNVSPVDNNPANITKPDSIEYVNSSGSFKSSVIRDSNHVIRGIVFTQN